MSARIRPIESVRSSLTSNTQESLPGLGALCVEVLGEVLNHRWLDASAHGLQLGPKLGDEPKFRVLGGFEFRAARTRTRAVLVQFVRSPVRVRVQFEFFQFEFEFEFELRFLKMQF